MKAEGVQLMYDDGAPLTDALRRDNIVALRGVGHVSDTTRMFCPGGDGCGPIAGPNSKPSCKLVCQVRMISK